MARRKFSNLARAERFAQAVGGQVNDCRNIPGCKFKFSVTYKCKFNPPRKKKKEDYMLNNDLDWCPEEERDFGYPNWYWK